MKTRSTMGLSILAGGLAFVGSASAVDLVVNGSFEQPPGVGWQGTFGTYNYSAVYWAGPPVPASESPGSLYSWRHAGPAGISEPLTQTLDLTAAASGADIDGNRARYTFSAWMASYTINPERPYVTLQFFDGTGTTQVGSIIALDRTSGANFVTFADGTTVFDRTTHEHHWAKYVGSGPVPGGARIAKVGVTRSPNAGLSGQPDTYTDLVKLDVTAICVTNTPPRFTCGPNQMIAEDSGPQTVPSWATDILPHSIVRVPTVFATDFSSLPAGTRILDPNGTNTPNPRVEGGVLHLTDANDAGGFGGWAIGPFAQQTFESLEASWKSRIGGGGGGGADGYSMNFGTDLADNFTGEEGTGTGLTVAVDTFDNGSEPPDVGAEINWGGSRVAVIAISKDDDGSGNFLRKDQFVNASLSVSAAGVATFTYDGNTISAALPGYTGVAVNQINFGARTGGANDNHWIDDLDITALPFDQSSVEAGQTVQFQVSNDNPGLFSAQPAVSPNGTLTYTPAPNACGVANLTVVAMDNGGTACNGDDTSDPCVRTITIAPVNDCPELASISPLTTRQDQPVTFVLDATDPDLAQGCPPQTLSAAIVTPPAHGTVSGSGLTATYTPNPGYLGPDSFQLAVTDGQCVSAPVTVQVTVILANQPPTCLAQLAPGNCTLTFPGDPTLYALALDNAQSCIQLDGSGSSDPDGDPLTYHWTINGFQVAMDPAQEPDGGGTGAGSGTVTLSGNTLTINITFSGLSANTTAAHIHGPAGRGTNAGVLYGLNAFTTLGASSGTISGTVTLTDGTGGYTIDQQMQQLCEGLWYINIHTLLHPGGEIRGQIDPGTSAGATVTACLDVGCHTVTLCVSDGRSASACSLSVCVITAGEAVEQCIELLDGMNLARKNKRPLLASLKAAAASFDRGNIGAAMNQLKAFQQKVRAQVAGANPAGAAALTDCVQRILAATECSLSAEAQGP